MLAGKAISGTTLALHAPPTPEFAIEFVNKVGLASRDSSRVEVPFAHVAPPDAEMWTETTTNELRVPIGRTGATKFQYLAIGKGTCQHGLIAGKTGSGKSTLFHVAITNLALWCSPEQVEFYLVDFKKGVEFKCYAAHRLPHARVVAIESDREFGLSVLQRVDDELKHRGDLFRQLGVQDVAGYKRAGALIARSPNAVLLHLRQQARIGTTDVQARQAGVRQGTAKRADEHDPTNVHLASQLEHALAKGPPSQVRFLADEQQEIDRRTAVECVGRQGDLGNDSGPTRAANTGVRY